MRKYFGTDGIRSRVGSGAMVPQTILQFGWVVGKVLAPNGGKVLIGKDTRASGYMFESALETGLSAAGANVLLLGPLPTPGIACLINTFHASVGLVISASHNPYYDNGIKLFLRNGEKLSDHQEQRIEDEMDNCSMTIADSLGKAQRIEDAIGRYAEFCKRVLDKNIDLDDMKIVLDCAHGATYMVAPQVFSQLGADVHTIGVSPDGLNINKGVGALHPELLQKTVVDKGANLGIAFDGDGDRVVMVDERGEVVDGDEILMIIADYCIRQGDSGVVGTQMSNRGLEEGLAKRNIEFRRTQVGDRYVMQELVRRNWQLGGETSGHIICRDKLPTGDGIIAALQVINALVKSNRTLSEAKSMMQKYPQKLINVPCTEKFKEGDLNLRKVVAAAENELGSRGRVLIRPSGTESFVRIMVESESSDQCAKWGQEIATVITGFSANS